MYYEVLRDLWRLNWDLSFLSCHILCIHHITSSTMMVIKFRRMFSFMKCSTPLNYSQWQMASIVPLKIYYGPRFHLCALLPVPQYHAAMTPQVKHSGYLEPLVMFFPTCLEHHRQSGRHSVCPLSCGWCFCGNSNEGHDSASHNSFWVYSCTGPSAWPPVDTKEKHTRLKGIFLILHLLDVDFIQQILARLFFPFHVAQ